MTTFEYDSYNNGYKAIINNENIHVIWILKGLDYWYVRVYFGHKFNGSSVEIKLLDCPTTTTYDMYTLVSIAIRTIKNYYRSILKSFDIVDQSVTYLSLVK